MVRFIGRTLLVICIGGALSVLSCSDSKFNGATGKKSGGTTPSAASQQPGPGKPTPAYVDTNGVVKDECKEIKPLPSTTTSLVLQYQWRASGDKSEFTKVSATPIVGRLNKDDPAPSILAVGFKECNGDVSQTAYVFAIDGRDGAQKWVSDIPVVAWLSPAIGDLNGDGNLEIAVVGQDKKLHILSSSGKNTATSSEDIFVASESLWPTGLTLADLTGEGTPSIVAGKKVLDGKTAALKFSLSSGNGFSAVGDVDGRPGLEIVTNAGIYSGKDGAALCTFATPIDDPTPGVLTATADHGVVIGVTTNDVVVYDGRDCSVQKTIAKPHEGGGPINIADFNGDGTLDFGTAGKNGYMAFGLSGLLWTTPTQDISSQRTGSTTFDFNGGGKNQIVYADEVKVHVFDGVDGRELYSADHDSYTARETPVVADVTGNGKARIIVGANSCLTGATLVGIRVFRDPDDAWVNTRPIWNQHTYNPLLVSDAGGLAQIKPESVSKPWLKAPYLAGYRNNISQPPIKSSCK
ncbi:MAG: VCBS repeat-containing protein [Deltaproteobacteria bacterium]|nr:VCBS repeat-containing protein [Deltaproteobacteria bacterium]